MNEKRKNNHCPNCGGFKYKKDGKIGCLSCDWTTEPKREADKDLPTHQDLNNTWR